MTGQRDKVYEAVLYSIFLHGKTNELLKQIHTTICVNPPKEQVSKSFMPKGMFAEIGRVLPRIIIPIAWPYLVALLTWIGAMVVLGYKLVLRYFGSGAPGV